MPAEDSGTAQTTMGGSLPHPCPCWKMVGLETGKTGPHLAPAQIAALLASIMSIQEAEASLSARVKTLEIDRSVIINAAFAPKAVSTSPPELKMSVMTSSRSAVQPTPDKGLDVPTNGK